MVRQGPEMRAAKNGVLGQRRAARSSQSGLVEPSTRPTAERREETVFRAAEFLRSEHLGVDVPSNRHDGCVVRSRVIPASRRQCPVGHTRMDEHLFWRCCAGAASFPVRRGVLEYYALTFIMLSAKNSALRYYARSRARRFEGWCRFRSMRETVPCLYVMEGGLAGVTRMRYDARGYTVSRCRSQQEEQPDNIPIYGLSNGDSGVLCEHRMSPTKCRLEHKGQDGARETLATAPAAEPPVFV